MGAIFRHQMDAPLGFDLESMGRATTKKSQALNGADLLLVQSFGQLLRHPAPPLELLTITKDFAKQHYLRSNGPLPREVARVLYVSCIAAALVKRGARITKLDDSHVRSGFEWGLSRPWLDENTRQLLQRGLETIGSPNPEAG